MADTYIQRFRYGNPDNKQALDQWTPFQGIGEDLGAGFEQVFNRGYEDPTYLTYRVEFGDWGTSVNGPNSYLGSTTFGAYASDYDELPIGLLDCNDTDDFGDRKQHYNAYNYLRSRNEDKRAVYLRAFRNGLYALTMKTPYVFSKISGLSALQQFNSKGAMRVKDATITIDCIEGLDLKIKTLMTWYRKAAWDDVYQRWILPENMREFKMIIYIFEQRQFHKADVDDVYYMTSAPTIYNTDLNANLPVFALECEPCEFVIDGVFGDSYGLAYADNQQATTQIRIKVKNVRTYLKNGLLPDRLARHVVYDLQDMLDRRDAGFSDTDEGYGVSVNSVKERFMRKDVWESRLSIYEQGIYKDILGGVLDDVPSPWVDVVVTDDILSPEDNIFKARTWRKLGRGILNIITSAKQRVLAGGGVSLRGATAVNIMDYLEFPDMATVASPVSEWDNGIPFEWPDGRPRRIEDEIEEPDNKPRRIGKDIAEPDNEPREMNGAMAPPDNREREMAEGFAEGDGPRTVPKQDMPGYDAAREIDAEMALPDAERSLPEYGYAEGDPARVPPTPGMEGCEGGRTIDAAYAEGDGPRTVPSYGMPGQEPARELPDAAMTGPDGVRDIGMALLEPDYAGRAVDDALLEPDMTGREFVDALVQPDMGGRETSDALLEPDLTERVTGDPLLSPDPTERASVMDLLEPDFEDRRVADAMLEPDTAPRRTSQTMAVGDGPRKMVGTSLVEPDMSGRDVKASLNGVDGGRTVPEYGMLSPDPTERGLSNDIRADVPEPRELPTGVDAAVMEERRKPSTIDHHPMEEREKPRTMDSHPVEEREKPAGLDTARMEPRKTDNDINVRLEGERPLEGTVGVKMDAEREKPVLLMSRTEFTDILSKATAAPTSEFAGVEQTNKADEERARRVMSELRLDPEREGDTASQMVRIFTDADGSLRESFVRRILSLQGDLRRENARIVGSDPMPGVEGGRDVDMVMVEPDDRERMVRSAAMANIDEETVRNLSLQSMVSLHENLQNSLDKAMATEPLESPRTPPRTPQERMDKVETVHRGKDGERRRKLLGHTLDEPRETPDKIL